MDPTNRHPRPQLVRARWTDLSGMWSFAYDDGDTGLAEHWEQDETRFERKIVVPFAPESEASGIGDKAFHPILWYRRTFDVPAGDRPARLVLHFGAVDYRARVWLNGQLLGEHEGGQTPFSFEIGHLLVPGREQTLVVRVEDDPHDLSQPRGKQYWEHEPGFIFYHRTSGIWRTVWLEPLDACTVAELRWTPDAVRLGVGLRLCIEGQRPEALFARVRLVCNGLRLTDDVCRIEGRELRREFLFDPELRMRWPYDLTWATHHPNLIEAEIELVDGEGAVLDRVSSYFGLRSIELRDGQIFLNGAPTFLRLVLAQNYWPESHLTPPSLEAMEREVALAKALGFNGVRIHQKVEDPRFISFCDRMGMLVWAEAANAFVFSPQAAERLTREWIEVVKRDINHPSIITWVPLNESWGVPTLDHSSAEQAFVKALYHLTRALDPTRPVIGNDGWQHAVGDIFGVHDYAFDGEILRQRYGTAEALEKSFAELRPWHYALTSAGHRRAEEPVVISEFGGLSIRPPEGDWFGYGTGEDAESVLETFRGLVTALLQSTAIAGFCYTQLTDTEQENNGLLTALREPKFDPAVIRAILGQHAASVPSEVLDAVQYANVERRRAERAKRSG